jgi:hypothetical protein
MEAFTVSFIPLINHPRRTAMKKLLIVGSCLFAMMMGASQFVSAREIAAQAEGSCKLKNEKVDKVLYHGDCRIKQTVNKDMTIWAITMGEAEPMLFAGKGTHYQHGPEDVTFHDRGNSAIFAWGDFTLKVKED